MGTTARINFEVGFQPKTAELRKQLAQIKQDLGNLSQIGSNALFQGITTEMQEASRAAAELRGHLQNATNVNTGQLDLSKFRQSLKQGGVELADYATKLTALGPAGTQAFLDISKAVLSANTTVQKSVGVLDKWVNSLTNTARWMVSNTLLRGFTSSVSSALSYMQDLDKSLNSIRIVTGKSKDEMQEFAKYANQAAKSLSATTTDYTDASLTFYQQGLADDEVRGRTQTTLKLANVTGQSSSEIAEQLTAIWNNFYDGSKSLEYYADVLTALGAATASSSDEISEGLQKFASVGETVGLSYEYAAAALATVTATTRQSADVVGTSFKTLFSRLQDLELGDTLDDGTTLGTYSQALNAVGVNIKTTSGELKDMDTILDELGEKWETLSSAQQVALAETVGGTRQYTQLIALMDNWDFFKENVGIATDSEGALQEQSDIYAQSWEAAKDRITASLEEIYQTLINEDFFIQLADFGSGLLGVLNDLIKGMGGFKGILAGISTLVIQIKSSQLQDTFARWSPALKETAKQAQTANKELQQTMLSKANEMVKNGNLDAATKQELQDTIKIAELRNDLLGVDSKLSDGTKARVSAEIDGYENMLAISREIQKLQAEGSNKAGVTAAGADANERVSGFINGNKSSIDFTKKTGANKNNATAGIRKVDIDKLANSWNAFNKGAIAGRKNMSKIKGMYVDMAGVANRLKDAQKEVINQIENGDIELIDPLSIEQVNTLNQALKDVGYQGKMLTTDNTWGDYINIVNQAQTGVDELSKKITNVVNGSSLPAEEKQRIIQDLNDINKNAKLINQTTEEEKKKREENIRTLAEEEEAIRAKAQAQVNTLQAFTSSAMMFSQITSLVSTLSDESTSSIDKITSGLTTVLFLAPSIISTIRNIQQAINAGQVALGATQGVLAAIAIIAATVVNIVKYFEAQAEKQIEAAKAAAELTKATKEQTKANQELVSSYEELFEEYKDHHDAMEDTSSVEEQMCDKIKELREQYDLTTASIALLTGTYEDYEKVLEEVQEKRQEELITSREEAKAQTKTIENGAYYASKKSQQSRSTSNEQLLLRLDGYGGTDEATAYNLYREALESAGATYNGLNAWDVITGAVGGGYVFDQSNIVDIYDSVVATSEKLEKMFGDAVYDIGQYVDAQEWTGDVSEEVEALRENRELISTYDLAAMFAEVNTLKEMNAAIEEWQEDLEKSVDTETAEKLIAASVKLLGDDDLEKLYNVRQSVEDIASTYAYWATDDHKELLTAMWETLDQTALVQMNYAATTTENYKEMYVAAYQYKLAVDSISNAVTNLQALSKYSDWDGLLTLDNYSEVLNAFAWGTNGLPTKSEFLYMSPQQRQKITQYGNYSQFAAMQVGYEQELQALKIKQQEDQNALNNIKDAQANYQASLDPKKSSIIMPYKELVVTPAKFTKTPFDSAGGDVGLRIGTWLRSKFQGTEYQDPFTPSYKAVAPTVEILDENGQVTAEGEALYTFYENYQKGVVDAEKYEGEAAELYKNLSLNITDENFDQLTDAYDQIAIAKNELDKTSDFKLLDAEKKQVQASLFDTKTQIDELTNTDHIIQLQLGVSQVYEDLDDIRDKIKDTISSVSKGISREDGNFIFDTETAEKLLDNDKLRQYLEWDDENSYWKVQEGQFEEFKNAVLDGYDEMSKEELEQLQAYAQKQADLYRAQEQVDVETYQRELEDINAQMGKKLGVSVDVSYDATNTEEAIDATDAIQDVQEAADELHDKHLAYNVEQYREMYKLAIGITEAQAGNLEGKDQTSVEEAKKQYEETVDKYNADLLGLKEQNQTAQDQTIKDGTQMAEALADYWQAVADKCSLGLSELREQSEEFLQAIADLGGLSVEELQRLIDAYHELKRELEALETTYERVSKKRETLFGTGHLDALKDELSLLESEASKLDELTSAAKASVDTWSTELNSLAAEGGLEVGKHFYYDENGVIQNYSELLNLYDRWNGGSDSDKEKASRLKTLIENQKQAVDDFWDYYNKKAEKAIEIQEKKIEVATYELDVYVEIKNMNDAATNFSKKIAQSIGDELTYGDEVFGYDVDNAQRQLELADQQVATYKELMALYNNNNGDITGGQLQKKLSELQNNIIKNGEDLLSMAETLENRLPNAIKAASTRFAEFTKQLSNNISVLEAIKKLYDLQNITYKTTEGFESLQTLYSEKMRASVQDAKNQRQWMQKAEAQLQEAEAALAAASETDTNYDMLKSARDALLEEYQSAQSAMLTSAEKALTAAQEMFTNAIEKAGYDFEQAMTNGLGFDYLQDQYEKFTTSSERYLDSVNSVYEISKLNRELQTSIDKANSTYAANQLKALEAEIAARQEDGKLSEYEVEILQAKYDMTLKQIALEEAQNSKTQMRLQRNSSGNWSYVYTTDAEAIANAQQELEDAQNEYYNLAKDRVNDITKEMIEMWSDYKDEVDDILEDSSLSTEEKQARLLEITEYYSNLMTELEADKQQAIADMTEAGGLVIDDFENTYAAALDDMTKDSANFEAALEDYMAAAEDAMNEYDDTIDEVTKDCGISFEELKEQIDKVSDSNTKLANTATSAIDEIWSKIPSIQDVATEFSNLAEKIREAILELQEYVQEAAKANFNDTYTGNGADGINLGDNNTIVPTGIGNGNGGDQTTGNEDPPSSPKLSDFTSSWQRIGYYDGQDDAKAGKTFNDARRSGVPTAYIEAYRQGYTAGYWGSSDGLSNAGNIYSSSQFGVSSLYQKFTGFDTGGYTGSFSGSALALLHQKELVLNEEDTSNILNAVNLTRSIGTDVLAAISSVLDANAASVGSVMAARLGVAVPSSTGAADLNQQVSISATFPGVQSASEIEQALNNLINEAAQYASIKRD